MAKAGYTYILANKHNTVLYVGATSNLAGRIWQHKTKFYPNSFSARYNTDKIIWYERFDNIMDAIDKENQLKGGSRAKKILLIEMDNPNWDDLYDEVLENEF